MSAALPLEGRLALRYLGARSGARIPSFGTLVAAFGIVVGVAVMLIVLAVMNGFNVELKERLLAVTAHATLTGLEGPLANWRDVQREAAAQPHVLAAAPYVEERALLAHGTRVSGALVRGIVPADEQRIGSLGRHVQGGELESLVPGGYSVLLGKGLAATLGVAVGDRLVLAAANGTATPAGVMPRLRRLTVAGLIDSGLYEFDQNVAVIELEDAARIFRLGDAVTGVELKVDDPFAAGSIVHQVAVGLGGGFFISDWGRQHENFFRSIATTKTIMFTLLLAVMAIAAFNVVATLVMLVREKRSDIAILRTLGLTPASLLAVFLAQGTAIGIVGTGLGVALGVLAADHLPWLLHALEALVGTRLFDAKVYFVEELPSVVDWGDVARIASIAFVLSSVATLYPAWRAARTQPAEALRHD
jgi:lipoprotein-releasing system permease protein